MLFVGEGTYMCSLLSVAEDRTESRLSRYRWFFMCVCVCVFVCMCVGLTVNFSVRSLLLLGTGYKDTFTSIHG